VAFARERTPGSLAFFTIETERTPTMTLTRFARTCVVAFLLCWVSAGSARAADATTVGTWKGPMDTQIGTVDVTLVIEGEAPLAGKATMDRYEGKIAVEGITAVGERLRRRDSGCEPRDRDCDEGRSARCRMLIVPLSSDGVRT
jgi:hypothetical protein